jgi:very-short-patch-repair endonuclease
MKKYIKPTNPKKARTSQPSKEVKNNCLPNKKINEVNNSKQNSKKRIYKSQKITPTKESNVKDLYILKNDTPKERKHPEYGTSKLETKFANNFLKKLGVKYQTQFKAESIGRYYDFYIPSANLLIEIDGDYFHSYNLIYEEMSPMQKKNKRVDKDKDKWAKQHKINLIRIWEHDINDNPSSVMEMLKNELTKNTEKYNKELEKKNRPKK